MYVVNDIENLVLLNDMGVLPRLTDKCDEIVLTNIRFNDFSHSYHEKILSLSKRDLIIVEVELEYYEFCEENGSQFQELGDGDISSLYYAQCNQGIVMTSSSLVASVADGLCLKTISIDELVSNHISDGFTVDMFKKMKIA